jgi:hypothetical protein
MDISHIHIDFGAQIPFLGSEGLFLHFCSQKYIFFTPWKVLDRWICHTNIILILGPKFLFEHWRLIFTLLTPRSAFFLAPFLIPDRWIYHNNILILEPKFRFWGLKAYFCIFAPKSIFFWLHVKFSIDGYFTRSYITRFWALNFVFGLLRLIFTFASCIISDRWTYWFWAQNLFLSFDTLTHWKFESKNINS